jgi:peptidoglycan hydrolase-like protein with peptidoglycan-binding domain
MVLTALATTIVLSLGAQGVASSTPVVTSAQRSNNSTSASQISATYPKFGDQSDDVVRLQQAMVARGFTQKGGVDGQFSARSQATLRNMQRAVGLRVTGVVDERTARFLGLITVSRLSPDALPKPGDNGEAVWSVQQALINNGVVVKGGADGAFGLATTVALASYQSRKGLPVTRVLDHATAFSLGLVSVAPPALVAAAAPAAKASEVAADHVATIPRALGFLAIGVGYMLIGPVVGYIVAISLLIGAIAIYEGRKPSLGLVAVAACAGVGFWVAFVLLLGTEQPQGRFF